MSQVPRVVHKTNLPHIGSSMHSGNGSTPELPLKRPYTRPLPPPQSRECVIMQIKEISDWQMLDSCEDLLVHWVSKRQKLRHGQYQDDLLVCDSKPPKHELCGSESSVNDSSENEPTRDEQSRDCKSKYGQSGDRQFEDRLANSSWNAGKWAVNESGDSQINNFNTQTEKKPLFQSKARRRAAQSLALGGNKSGRDMTADLVYRSKNYATSQPFLELESARVGSGARSSANNVMQADGDDNKCEAYELMKLTSNNEDTGQGSRTDQDYEHVASTLATLARTDYEEKCCKASRENRERNLATQKSLKKSDKGDSIVAQDSWLLRSTNDTCKASNQNNSTGKPSGCNRRSDATSAILAGDPEMLQKTEDVTEAGLDVCQAHVKTEYQGQASIHLRGSNIDNSAQKVNPYSRMEANRYRTQDRHITDTATPNIHSTQNATKLPGEDRLRQLTRLHEHSKPSARIKMKTEDSSCSLHKIMESATNVGREWRDDDAVSSHTISNPNAHDCERDSLAGDDPVADIARANGTPLHFRSDHVFNNTDYPVAGRAYSYSRNRPVVRPLSTQMQFPPQGRINISVTVPTDFDQLDPERQDIITKHEILKERKRDLEAASQGIQLLSKLAANKHLDKTEQEWLATHQLFLLKVVKEKLSGRSARPKVRTIVNSMRGRIGDKQNLAAEEACTKMMFGSYTDLIEEELASIIESMALASKLRKETRETRWKEKLKRQEKGEQLTSRAFGKALAPIPRKIHMGHEADAEILMNDEGLATVPRSATSRLTITERKRMAQFKYKDRQLDKLKEKLAEFTTPSHLYSGYAELDSIPQTQSMVTGNDVESTTSEEDHGDEFYVGTRMLNVEKASHTANDESETLHRPQPNTDNLVSHNVERGSNEIPEREYQTRNEQPNSVQSSLAYVDPATHAEFDDVLQANDMKKNSYFENECYKYLVTAVFHGVQDHEDGTMYDFGRYLDRDHANDIVDRVAADFKYAQTQSQDYQNDKSINEHVTQNKQGLRERLIEVGEDAHASCRVVLEREVYNPSERAYQNARVQAAVNAKPIYLVLWKKSIRTKADYVQLLNPEDGGNHIQASLYQETETSNNASQEATSSGNLVNNALSDTIQDFEDGTRQGNNVLCHEVDMNIEDDLFGPEPPMFLASETLYNNLPNNFLLTPIQDSRTSKWSSASTSTADKTVSAATAAATTTTAATTVTTATDPASMSSIYTLIDLPTPPDSTSTVTSRISPIPQPIHDQLTEPTSVEDRSELIREPHYSEIRHCTSIATANRLAKDLFMQYFKTRYNHSKDFMLLRNEEDHIERELEDFADMRTWERTVHSETTIKKRDQSIPATETYRVWVAETWLKGPAN